MYYNKKLEKKQKYIIKCRKKYIKYSTKIENNQKSYVENIYKINLINQAQVKLKYDFLKKSFDDYMNIITRTTYLLNQINQEDFTSFFITLTLPSQYHPFDKCNKKNDIHNPNIHTIKNGYQKLNEMFRRIQKDFRKSNETKKTTLKFVKVIEPHKTFVPHLHGIVFVPKGEEKTFINHLKNLLQPKTIFFKTVTKTLFLDNENMGRTEIEQIENISRTMGYILKYTRKSLNPTTEENYHLINGWKKMNRIRSFTMSNVSIPRFISKKLYNNLGKFIVKKEKYNILEELEKISDIRYQINDKASNQKMIRTYGNHLGRFLVEVEVERTIRKIEVNQKMEEELDEDIRMILEENDFTIQDEEQAQHFYNYRITRFIIYDKINEEVIYDKNDYDYVIRYTNENNDYWNEIKKMKPNENGLIIELEYSC